MRHDYLENYYDAKPVRRGSLRHDYFSEAGHSKSRKMINRKGRRGIKKGNG